MSKTITKVKPTFRRNLIKLLCISLVCWLSLPSGGSGWASAQNVGINTTGAAPAATNLLEILQPATATGANTTGLYVEHPGAVAGATGYALQAIKNGASLNNIAAYLNATGATNNYALIVPSGGGRVGLGTITPFTLLDVSGSFSLREGTALALINGDNNNIFVTDFSFFRITGPTAAFTITGITGGTDGRIITLYNTTGQTVTIANENISSTAANRIFTMKGADVTTLAGPNIIQLQYNANVARWLIIGGQNLTATSSGAPGWLVYTASGF